MRMPTQLRLPQMHAAIAGRPLTPTGAASLDAIEALADIVAPSPEPDDLEDILEARGSSL